MNIINQNIKFIRKQKGMTQQKFADAIGIKRSSLGAYEEGRAKPSHNTIMAIAEKFHISIDKLFNEDLSAIADQSVFGEKKASLVTTSAMQRAKGQADVEGKKLRVLSITVGKDDKENIELVPMKAAAGYLQGMADPEFIEGLPKFRLPFLPTGTYRAFEIKGESMLPLASGSIVVGEYIENWQDIKNNQTYIVVSNDDGIVYKRIVNTLGDNRKLILKSDNPDYPAYSIHVDEVAEVWQAKAFISKELPGEATTLEKLMSTVMELQQEVIKLKDKNVN